MTSIWGFKSVFRYSKPHPNSTSIRQEKYIKTPSFQIAPRQVQLRDFMRSLEAHRRTVTEVDLERFQEFTTHYGEKG